MRVLEHAQRDVHVLFANLVSTDRVGLVDIVTAMLSLGITKTVAQMIKWNVLKENLLRPRNKVLVPNVLQDNFRAARDEVPVPSVMQENFRAARDKFLVMKLATTATTIILLMKTPNLEILPI